MPKYRFPVSVLLFCIFSGPLKGQDQSSLQGFGIEANALAGKVIKHTVKFTAPIPTLSSAFDVNFIWQTYGKKDWQQRRRFPLIGIGLTYTDYGLNPVFGNCIGIYPNLQIPLINSLFLLWVIYIDPNDFISIVIDLG